MARKLKHGKGGGKYGAPHTLTDTGLGDAAKHALHTAHYKDAIELCKELCKRNGSAENRELLAAAYAGRAEDLADKGMVKEAVVVWRNRADLCGRPLMEGPYPGWLKQLGDMKSLLHAYRACLRGEGKDPVRSAEQAAIEAGLAAYVLTAPEAALADLPADSPLMCGRLQARAALKAYCESAPDLDAALKAIPFRSPYRDLGRILKLMARMETDPAALDDLARIAASSPFARLAEMAKLAALPLDRWVPAVVALHGEDRALALEFKDIPDAAKPVVDELLRLAERPAAGALFDWLVRQHPRVPPPGIEALCRSLLTQVPDRIRVYRQVVGDLAEAEAQRILALHAEVKRDIESAVEHWLHAVDALEKEGGDSSRLRAALILRHLADGPPCSSDGGLHRDAVAWLRRSLEFDPDDVESFLRLLPAYRARQDLKTARALLDDALSRFPRNANVLLEAIEIALAGNAFKKAVGFARRVLELDPINPRVRSLLGQAHMAHARKQVKSHKWDAARKELSEAAEWVRLPADRSALKRLQGIVDMESGRVADGQRVLNEAMAEADGPLLGYFLLAMEMARLGRDPAKSLRGLGYAAPKAATAADVLALVRTLDGIKGESETLRKAVAALQKTLREAAKHLMLEPDFLLVCETFQRHGLSGLVSSYAEAATKKHPHSPIFVFHRVNAAYGQRPWSIPPRDYAELTRALEMAIATGDHRTVVRIEQLLMPPEPDLDFEGEPFFGGKDGMFEDMLTPQEAKEMRSMMDFLGPDSFLDLARQMLGKKAFKQLEAAVGKDHVLALLMEALGMSGDTGSGLPILPAQPSKPPKPPRPVKPKDVSDGRSGDSRQRDLFDE